MARRNRRSADYRQNWDLVRHKIGLAHYWKAKATGDPDAARRAVNELVAAGSFIKPETCQRCWNPTESRQLQFHHPSHLEPLTGEWLCIKCHAKETRSLKEDLVRKM